MAFQNIIFDLDGTLIDSSASILASFQASFDIAGIKAARPLGSDIIGPPLKEALALLSGSNDSALINELAANFRHHYDSEGYRHTTVFSGIPELMMDLAATGIPLYIATNKRIKPTRLIIEHLGWARFFSGVFGLDSLEPPAASKADLISHMADTYAMNTQTTLYIGDRIEDSHAANSAKVAFSYASWGYGSDHDTDDFDVHRILKKPGDLLSVVQDWGTPSNSEI